MNEVDQRGGPPAVSLLCSAYRTEDYLAETIESVLAQTRPDWQLVIVDNGRDDAIARIVHTYLHDPRITLVRQDNRGISGGVNTAAAHATGRYLAVLHSDDLVTPDFCDRMAGILDTHPEIDAVASDAHLIDDAGARLASGYLRSVGVRRVPALDQHITVTSVIGGGYLYYGGAVRREAWNAVGGLSGDTPVEDLRLWLRLLSAGYSVRVTPEKLGLYRIRGDSTSRDPAQVEDFEHHLESALIDAATRTPTYEAFEAATRAVRKIRYDSALRCARTALLQGDTSHARRSAAAAHRYRRTLRSSLVLGAVTMAPGILRLVHPAKQHVARASSRLMGAVRTG